MLARMLIADRLRHKRPVFSFEFFPPSTQKGEATLMRSLERLAPLQPDFVSVTYGAGGSTRARTLEIVRRIKGQFGIEAMAHLTCVGSTRDEIAGVLDALGEADVRNVLALRGDPPKGHDEFVATEGGFRYASELIAFIRDRGDFCIGAACYPEVHPEAESAAADLANLRRKVDAGAQFVITQLFFDNLKYFEFERSVAAAGIDVPMLAGIMPVTNAAQVERFTQMCGATLPSRLRERLAADADDAQEVFWTGVSYAAWQCRELLMPPSNDPFGRPQGSVAGVHFYTLNKSPATRAIFQILDLARSAAG